MIPLSLVYRIHQSLIDEFGGAQGVRDLDGLKSALERPLQTFDNTELYPAILEKVAAVLESILINHPFVDGNKRTAYAIARIVLLQNRRDINATEQDKYQLIVGIAAGDIKFDEILSWLKIQSFELGP